MANFRTDADPTFKGDVLISVPGKDAPPMVLEVEFRHKTRTQLKAFYESLPGRPDEDALGEIIAGWNGGEGAPPYSAENLAALLNNYPSSALDLFNAYNKAIGESRIKN